MFAEKSPKCSDPIENNPFSDSQAICFAFLRFAFVAAWFGDCRPGMGVGEEKGKKRVVGVRDSFYRIFCRRLFQDRKFYK